MTAIAFFLVASIATAGTVSGVTDQSLFGGTDQVTWADGGSYASSFSIASDGGINFTGGLSSGSANGHTAAWFGSPLDAAGSNVLFDNNAGILTLNSGLGQFYGIGLGIQDDGNSFTAKITALNGSGAALGTYSVSSDANGDAVWLGIMSTDPEIAGFSIQLTSVGQSWAVSSVDLIGQTTDVAPTAEATPLVLVGTGLGLLGWVKRRRIARNAAEGPCA